MDYRLGFSHLASREQRLAIAELGHLLWTELAAPATSPTARAVEGLLRALRLPVNAIFAANKLARAIDEERDPAMRGLATGLVEAARGNDPLLSLARGRHPDADSDTACLARIEPHLTHVLGGKSVRVATVAGAVHWLRALHPVLQARAAALAVDGSAGFILPVVAGAMTEPGRRLIQQLRDELGHAVQTVLERPTTAMPDPTVVAWEVEWKPDETLRPLLLPGALIPIRPDTPWASMLPDAAWPPEIYISATQLITTAAIELLAVPAEASRAASVVEKAIAAWQQINPRCHEDPSGSITRYVEGWVSDVEALDGDTSVKPTCRCWVWLQFEKGAEAQARWTGRIASEAGDVTTVSSQARGTWRDIGAAAADTIVALLAEPALIHVVVPDSSDPDVVTSLREALEQQNELVLQATMHLESRNAVR